MNVSKPTLGGSRGRPEVTKGRRVEMRGITKTFGELRANDDVSLTLEPGRIHALLGENGAGKTTLLKILTGYLQPTQGVVRVDGHEVNMASPNVALGLGIGLVHQHSVLVPNLTVLENVLLGQQPGWILKRYNLAELRKTVADELQRFKLQIDVDTKIENLSADQVQQIEIIRLLIWGVTTIVLDEPTAILGAAYVDDLFNTLREMRARGRSVCIITHKLKEVMAIADDVTVLRSGKVTARLSRGDFDESALASALLRNGTQGLGMSPRGDRTAATKARYPSTPKLVLDGLTVRGDRGQDSVQGLGLTVGAGEMVGVIGVEGNGQRELIEAISGNRLLQSGTISINGKTLSRVTPHALDRAGVAVISEDRLRWDLLDQFTIAENIVLTKAAVRDKRYTNRGVLRKGEIRRHAASLVEEFSVQPPNPAMVAGQLSGGNQQKVVLAREVSELPEVLVAAHPTRGLDIAAASFVRARIASLARQGTAVLVMSADIEELWDLVDRLFVILNGKLVYECRPEHGEPHVVGRAMVGLEAV